MITPSAEAVDANPEIVAMGRRRLSVWPQWLAELPEPVFYRDDGTLLLWHHEDAGEAHRFERLLARRDAQAHLVHVDAARLTQRR
jgi:glycine oxidase